MTEISQSDLQRILHFVEQLYQSLNLEDLPSFLANTINQLIVVDCCVYGGMDFKTAQIDFQANQLSSVSHLSPGVETVANQHFYEHPFVAHSAKTISTQALILSDFVTVEQLHRLEGVYQKLMRPMGMEEQMAITFNTGESPDRATGSVKALTLWREQRNFTERDRLLLTLLRPHLIQAQKTAELLFRFRQEQQQWQQTFNAMGCIVLSESAQVQWITANAEALLQKYFAGQRLQRSLPELLQQWLKFQLMLRTQTTSVPQPQSSLRLEQEGQFLTIRLMTDPFNRQLLLLLEERAWLTFSIESLEWLGLSRREAEILFWVAQRQENPDIARRLCISVSTVRKHLENIYAKLGVKTRLAAVMYALEQLGLLQ